MTIRQELARFALEKDTVLTIGVFDGVHLGHRHLLGRLVEESRRRNLLSGVVTFRQHPVEVLSPDICPPFLSDLEERICLLRQAGIQLVIPLAFTEELARCPARRFIEMLQKDIKMRGLVVGPDFALGSRREGDIRMLEKLSRGMGFSITVVPPLVINGEVVSSTAIRQALAEGDMKKVERMMGRPFSLRGPIVKGAGRGIKLGFPTANLAVTPGQAVPSDGVYAGWAYVDGKTYPAMTNIGTCPTFGGCDRTVEVYLVDFNGDIYSHLLKVDFIQRLRDEKGFGSVEELKRQVAEDINRGLEILKVNQHEAA